MFEATSGQDITFTISNDAQKIVNLTKVILSGTDAKIVFNEMSANNGSDGKFKGFGNDERSPLTLSLPVQVTLLTTPQNRSRTVKVKKPSRSSSLRKESRLGYEAVNPMLQLTGLRQKWNIRDKAVALFNSDNYDSDGDGYPTCSERCLWWNSLSNDNDDSRPKPVKEER